MGQQPKTKTFVEDLSESIGQKLINPNSVQWRKSYKLPRPITIFDLWKNLLFMLMTARISVRLDSEFKTRPCLIILIFDPIYIWIKPKLN